MPILRISQQPGSGPNRHQITVEAEEVPGFQRSRISREIQFALSPGDAEKIRWYLEDFLQFAQDPAPQIAARVEKLMVERGEALFRAIFDEKNEAIRLWTMVEPHLSSTRIEIVTGVAEASSIPWELIRDPHTRVDLALSAQAFVRSQPEHRLPSPRRRSRTRSAFWSRSAGREPAKTFPSAPSPVGSSRD